VWGREEFTPSCHRAGLSRFFRNERFNKVFFDKHNIEKAVSNRFSSHYRKSVQFQICPARSTGS
jgi:hypothetical protein